MPSSNRFFKASATSPVTSAARWTRLGLAGRVTACCTVLAGAGFTSHAQTQTWVDARDALTTRNVHLRAGPSREYPVVAVLGAGTRVWVQGCLPAYTWCDVAAGGDRGWVYAGNLSFEVQGAWVPAPRVAPELGIGIIGFILGTYWADHYRDRPWYSERDRWPHPPPLSPAPRREPPPAAHPRPPPRPALRGPAPGQPHMPAAPPPHAAPPAHGSPPPRVAPTPRPPPPHRAEPPQRATPTPQTGPPQARPTPAPPPPRAAERKAGRDPDEQEDSRRRIGPPGRPTTP